MGAEIAAIFGGAFVIALSGALMPGPLLTLTVAHAARRGFISGPLLMLGHAALELALIAALIYGLGPIIQKDAVKGAISLLGGGALLWMGGGMARSAGGMSLNIGGGEEKPAGAAANPVAAGALASVSNPYWIFWWATIGLGYLISSLKLGVAGVAAFFLGHISADFLWYSAISLGVSGGRKMLTDKVYRAIVSVCGAALVGFGGWFLFAAAGYLLK